MNIRSTMIYVDPAPSGEIQIPVWHRFLAPSVLKIRMSNGEIKTLGYGIGERIQILEPAVKHLICSYEIKDEILLPDGSAIIEWPDDIHTQAEYGSGG